MNDSNIKTRIKIFEILIDNEINSIRIDYLLSSESFSKDFSLNEIRFMHRVAFGIIRNKSKLDYYISNYYDGNFKKLLIKYKIILRIGLYQLFYMDSVPNYAAVDTTVNLCKKVNNSKSNLINAIMRKLSKNINIKDRNIEDVSIKYSHPKWMIDRWFSRWDHKKVIKLLNYNNLEPKIWFRVNTLKSSIEEVYSMLNQKKMHFKISDVSETFFYSKSVQELLKSNIMRNGFISVQNPANGLVVKLLNPQQNKIIFDGCAAPGGKTNHINELTKGKNQIYSYDIDNKRIALMLNNLSNNIRCYRADLSRDPIKNYDVGLIDVPCTGTGVLSKRVDIKWRRKIEDISEMNKIQLSIMKNVSKYLNNKGVLVYSTCSIEEEENWGIVNNFLNFNDEFQLDRADKFVPTEYVDENGCLSTFPSYKDLDGIFAARLIKK